MPLWTVSPEGRPEGIFSTTPVSSKDGPLWTLHNFLVTCPLERLNNTARKLVFFFVRKWKDLEILRASSFFFCSILFYFILFFISVFMFIFMFISIFILFLYLLRYCFIFIFVFVFVFISISIFIVFVVIFLGFARHANGETHCFFVFLFFSFFCFSLFLVFFWTCPTRKRRDETILRASVSEPLFFFFLFFFAVQIRKRRDAGELRASVSDPLFFFVFFILFC